MKFIDWAKKNYLIIILFIIVVLILTIKINNNIKTDSPPTPSATRLEQQNLRSPIPTTINKILYNNKTKEEILQMESEEKNEFITKLSREKVEELDMMPNYDFSVFLPYEGKDFVVEKFDKTNNQLIVTPLIDDQDKIKNEVESWLFYENGNNPGKITIIFTEKEDRSFSGTEDIDYSLPE